MDFQVFVPAAAEQAQEAGHDFYDIPVFRFFNLVKILLFGWPLYLLTNVSGRAYESHASHFDPYSPIFTKKERSEIIVSDAALAIVGYGLFVTGQTFGWGWFCKVHSTVLACKKVVSFSIWLFWS